MSLSVSVVIPAYNSAETICEALDSVAAQTTNVDLEIIVVDDCSSDGTCTTVQEWIAERTPLTHSRTHPPTHSLHSLPSNSGPAVARNQGIELALGEWVAFLDSDDAWLPHRVEVQLELASQHPDVVMWCGGTVGMEESPRITRMDTDERMSNLCLREITLEQLAVGNPVATSTVLVRKAVLDEVGGFDTQFRGPEDYDLWLRIAAKGSVMKIEMPLSRYRFVKGSLSMDERRFLPEVFRVLEKAYGNGGVLAHQRHLKRLAYAQQYKHASWMAFCRNSRKVALFYLLKGCFLRAMSGKLPSMDCLKRMVRYAVGPLEEC